MAAQTPPPDRATTGPRGARPATARVGMVGGGQLARMTHAAAIDLGIDLHVLAVEPDEPASLAGALTRLGSPDDLDGEGAHGIEVVGSRWITSWSPTRGWLPWPPRGIRFARVPLRCC